MRINFGGAWWNPDEPGASPPAVSGPSSQAALRLILEWKNGQQNFTFQTSGSTGSPKVISFQRSQLEASARLSIDALGLHAGLCALACLDSRFVAGAMMVVRSILADMDLLVREPSGNPLKHLTNPADFIALVPLQLTTILEESPELLDKTSTVIIGGAMLPEPVADSLSKFKPAFFATYGMTETLTHIALRRLNGAGRQTSFHPLNTVSVSADDRGCLLIEAPHLGATAVQTNDLVTWMPDGGFRIKGRADEVINSGAVKVHPANVEYVVGQVFKTLGIPRRYFVSGAPDERLHQSVCLVVEGSPLSPEITRELLAQLRKQLTSYETPRRLLFTPHFSETPTQKVDKRATLTAILDKTP